MPRTRQPRAGSMQFWPRVKSKSLIPRIRKWQHKTEQGPLGFAGYKAGMTHVLATDNNPNSLTKGSDIFYPITVVECPQLKIYSLMFYKNSTNGPKLTSQVFADNLDKHLGRSMVLPKKKSNWPADFDFVRLLCHTQPNLTCTGKKNPESFEIAIGGTKDQQLSYAKEKLGKELGINEVFKEGQQIDSHSVTKGKGFQGAVRRFGVTLRHHKSEKSRRNPGSLGAWNSQGHIMWRTAHAGKMGNHLRTEYNKLILKIGNKPDEINVKGGYLYYGVIKNPYLLIKGSLAGKQKSLIKFTGAIRQTKSIQEPPQIVYISTESKQGR